jgi:beta-lactamase regulating signal transducer with metallopeptidase domain
MEQFSYSFSVSMMHSIWQTGALLLFYYIYLGLFPKSHPVVKRNLLFALLAAQLICSVITFSIYFNNTSGIFNNTLAQLLTASFTGNSFLHNYAEYLLYIYLMAVLYKFASMAYQWISFRKTYKNFLSRPSVELKLFTQMKAFQFGIKRKVSLWYSTNITTPMTFGFFKPVILMPMALVNNLTVEEAEALIIHELTHIRNHDFVLNWMLVIMETVFFFNPFIRLITGKIKMEREKSCDTQVLQFNYCYISYAEALLKTARQNNKFSTLQMAAVKRQSHLIERIRFFSGTVNYQFHKRNYPGLSFLGMLIILLFNIYIIAQFKNEKLREVPVFAIVTPSLILDEVSPVAFAGKADPLRTDLMRASYSVAEQAKAVAVAEKEISEQQHEIYDNEAVIAEGYSIQPVSIKETVAPEEFTKELIINEENSAGDKVTKVYKVTLKDGKWIKEPLYMITELKPQLDSLQIKLDSLQILIESIQ